jgi:DNA-binding LacI/PurR family transcriptional regulator
MYQVRAPTLASGHAGRAEIGGVHAVVAIPDMVALGAYRGLQAVGMRIPEDNSGRRIR